jgi:hypothetical protein
VVWTVRTGPSTWLHKERVLYTQTALLRRRGGKEGRDRLHPSGLPMLDSPTAASAGLQRAMARVNQPHTRGFSETAVAWNTGIFLRSCELPMFDSPAGASSGTTHEGRALGTQGMSDIRGGIARPGSSLRNSRILCPIHGLEVFGGATQGSSPSGRQRASHKGGCCGESSRIGTLDGAISLCKSKRS